MPARDHVVGIDLGTSSVHVVVGRASSDGEIEILGFGTCESKGLRKGTIVNIEQTVTSIETAMRAAHKMCGRRLHSAFVSISDGHIQSFDSHGIIAIKNRNSEIANHDVANVLEAAQAVKIPVDREVLHVSPKNYIVDGQQGIKDPVGIMGVRLETYVHIVTAASSSVQNIIKCVNRAGCEVEEIVLEAYASGESVLTPEERELGVLLVDFGGGTTDSAVFTEGVIHHSKVLALAGGHVTNDISVGLRTPAARAEEIKIQHGVAMASMVDDNEVVTVPGIANNVRHVLRRGLVDIIEARMDEIFGLLNADLERAGCRKLFPAGAVLTGGGTLMEGTAELAEAVMRCPVRIGRPRDFVGQVEELDDPRFACATGLVRNGLRLRSAGKLGRHRSPSWSNKMYTKTREFVEHFLWGG
jgi:cell division protein FtsA